MSTDYDGVGGIGIKVTEEMIKKFIKLKFFTKEDWDDEAEDCLDTLGLVYRFGGSYCEYENVYFFVEGDNLKEINKNSTKFLNTLKSMGINLNEEDLKVIEDILIS